jgi:hypothetical protein
VPGRILSEADRLECLFFGGFDPHYDCDRSGHRLLYVPRRERWTEALFCSRGTNEYESRRTDICARGTLTVSSYSFVTKTPSWMCCHGFRLALISPSTFGACKELSVGVRALSPKPADEVEIDAG